MTHIIYINVILTHINPEEGPIVTEISGKKQNDTKHNTGKIIEDNLMPLYALPGYFWENDFNLLYFKTI